MERNCEKIQELLPLLSNGRLTTEEFDLVKQHLKECTVCAKYNATLRPLFGAARQLLQGTPNSPHPNEDQLDIYVFAANDLGYEERQFIESHLERCEDCAELVSALKNMPQSADELLNETTAPELSRLDAELTKAAAEEQPTKTSRLVLLNSIAAAAVVVLAAIVVVRWPFGDKETIVPAHLPAVTRSTTAQPVEFVIPTTEALLELSCDVVTDTERSYQFYLEHSTTDSLIASWFPAEWPAATGRFVDTLQLAPGEYRLRILDIDAGDTVTVIRSFAVRLES